MAEKSRTKLLELVVEQHSPRSWEWSIYFGWIVLNSGFEDTVQKARFVGNDALFKMFISPPGWDE